MSSADPIVPGPGRPDHLWAGDEFGHNCVRCDDGSPWRCDPAKHPAVDFIRRVVEAVEPGVTEGLTDGELLAMHQRIKEARGVR